MIKPKKVLRIVLTLVLFYVLFQGFLWIISNKTGISAHCREIETFITDNQENWHSTFTTSFDEAVACRTDICKQNRIGKTLAELRNTHKPRFFQTSYFIRLNSDGNIEKWLRSGEVVTTIPSTGGEKKVVQVLAGESEPICTQNWKLSNGLSYMTYLDDEASEAETILPVMNGSEVLGAIVSRFGD
jgi:hypothetical protein